MYVTAVTVHMQHKAIKILCLLDSQCPRFQLWFSYLFVGQSWAKPLISLPLAIFIYKGKVIILTIPIHLNIHPSFYPANMYLRSAYCIIGSRRVTMAMKVPSLLPQCLEPTVGQWNPWYWEMLQWRPKWDTEQLTGGNISPQQRLGGSGKDRVMTRSSVKMSLKI